MLKTLVIDDSKATRAVLSQMMQEMGYAVFEAPNGKDALDMVKRHGDTLVLILVDWNMPVMDGYQFVVALRQNKAMDKTRVIFVTAETELSRVSSALSAGANEYVMKPFTKEVLASKIRLLGL